MTICDNNQVLMEMLDYQSIPVDTSSDNQDSDSDINESDIVRSEEEFPTHSYKKFVGDKFQNIE